MASPNFGLQGIWQGIQSASRYSPADYARDVFTGNSPSLQNINNELNQMNKGMFGPAGAGSYMSNPSTSEGFAQYAQQANDSATDAAAAARAANTTASQAADSANNAYIAAVGLYPDVVDIKVDCDFLWSLATATGLGAGEVCEGFLTPQGANQSWQSYVSYPTGVNAAENGQALYWASQRAQQSQMVGLMRTDFAPLFCVCFNGDFGGNPGTSLLNLRSVDPSQQYPGESDLSFLQRVKPLVAWVGNFNGSPVPGYSDVQSDGSYWDYYYYPMQMSAWPVARLFDYVASSGQNRNSITDLMTLLTTIPFHY